MENVSTTNYQESIKSWIPNLSQMMNTNTDITSQTAGRPGKFNFSTIIIIITIISLILIGTAYYYFYVVPTNKALYRANKELIDGRGASNEPDSTEVEIIIFLADWCPYSKQAIPEWEQFKKENEKKVINGYSLIFNSYTNGNEDAESEKMMDKFNIEAFPTVKMLKDGQVIDFDAKPTLDNLNNFVNTVLNNNNKSS